MTSKTLTRADLSEAVHRQIGLSRSESADLVKS
ncbi:MAG: integration host factor subunit alpha, partial [Alphaproteobacteria bacterium]|nr:integration host factor subunit alpha [Alphaproteobacteria bacterium]